jgi:hypothetical protein
MKNSKRDKKIPGPKPEVVNIQGDWQLAVKKSLQVKKPAQGWPK